ncbi:MAG TPA: LacI family transcriptional regulator, partial [Lentisphaeria bacterium]|nr:LacI family transcriptional regulator [Lentisphaeria bacterium]
MPVTIHDLAKLAGLNASTISRALRNDPRVRKSTRELVRELARRHGYTPNLPARQLAA